MYVCVSRWSCMLCFFISDSKDCQIGIDLIGHRPFRVVPISNPYRFEGSCYVGCCCRNAGVESGDATHLLWMNLNNTYYTLSDLRVLQDHWLMDIS